MKSIPMTMKMLVVCQRSDVSQTNIQKLKGHSNNEDGMPLKIETMAHVTETLQQLF